MDVLWPWLTIAGFGAMHGLSPANGWMFAAARGMHARDDAQARRALLPIAIGHVASVAIVAAAVAQGIWMDQMLVQRGAGGLLIGLAAYRWLRGVAPHTGSDIAGTSRVHGHLGLALWSCLMATAHGTGLMLVPALLPMCMSGTSARAIGVSGSLLLALIAVGVHLAAMLVTTGAIAGGVCRCVGRHPRLFGSIALRHAATAALAVCGALLMAR